MEKGNVLVIGNSGVGKSTLINAVLGEDRAETSFGTTGTTKELKIYENDNVPFRLIDTVGFEPSFFKEQKAINAVKKWSKEAASAKNQNEQINVIWFCVDGTSRKLFDKTIKDLSKATGMWKSVPIVVAITKSYSVPDRSENIQMVNNAFASQKIEKNLKKVIPVVAETYTLNDTAFAPPEGISEIIDYTNELLPEGIKAAKKDIDAYKLSRKRMMSQSMIGLAVSGASVVGAVPIPVADTMILTPLEVGLVSGISKIYEIGKNEKSNKFINSIIQAGTVGTAAKAAISALKAIPGVNIAASALNAIVAGTIVALLGEASVYMFEQVYLGNKSLDDIDWATKIVETKFANEISVKVKKLIDELDGKYDKESISKAIKSVMKK